MMGGAHQSSPSFVTLDWRGRPTQIEYQFVGSVASEYPVIVFLHEGLGSLSMWKGFPRQFCERHGFTGLVFSRYGYGASTPRPDAEN
jgi:pimeloyl-ACP methyl ester carboxylesterase